MAALGSCSLGGTTHHSSHHTPLTTSAPHSLHHLRTTLPSVPSPLPTLSTLQTSLSTHHSTHSSYHSPHYSLHYLHDSPHHSLYSPRHTIHHSPHSPRTECDQPCEWLGIKGSRSSSSQSARGSQTVAQLKCQLKTLNVWSCMRLCSGELHGMQTRPNKLRIFSLK